MILSLHPQSVQWICLWKKPNHTIVVQINEQVVMKRNKIVWKLLPAFLYKLLPAKPATYPVNPRLISVFVNCRWARRRCSWCVWCRYCQRLWMVSCSRAERECVDGATNLLAASLSLHLLSSLRFVIQSGLVDYTCQETALYSRYCHGNISHLLLKASTTFEAPIDL